MDDWHPSAFITALINFSLNLYKEISAAKKDASLFISPLSISMALSLTSVGASGRTKSEMHNLLFGDFISEESDVHSNYAAMQSIFGSKDGLCQLHMANRLFANQSIVTELLDSFVTILKNAYDSDMIPMDFSQASQASNQVNTWISQQTNNKIHDLITADRLSAMTQMILVNAIYFKCDWKLKFDQEDTKKQPFYISQDKEIEVDMMQFRRMMKLHHTETDKAQVLGLQYGESDLCMFIYLPDEKFGLADMEKELTVEFTLECIRNAYKFEKKIQRVAIPKFRLEETVQLVPILSKLGAPSMFTNADFSGINGRKDICVSDVIHKAFIEVNEEGTEAAAASAVLKVAKSGGSTVFIADHPFLFMIADPNVCQILFMGRYYGPK